MDCGKRRKMLNSIRSTLYFVARIMGDINAILKGRVARRIGRRAAGKLTGRALWRIFK
jgi:hypothetical protein